MLPRHGHRDVLEGQRIPVYYDPVDNFWHERLLLAKKSSDGRRWVVATPDLDIYEEDVGDSLGMVRVGPRGGAPRGLPGELYRFDPDDLEEHGDRLMRDGLRLRGSLVRATDEVTLAGPLAATDAGATPGPPGPTSSQVQAAAPQPVDEDFMDTEPEWICMEDRGSLSRGDLLPHSAKILWAGKDRGVARLAAGIEVAVAKADSAPRAAREAEGDLRTLPVSYTPGGIRQRPFADAVSQLSTTEFADFRVKRPRTTQWLMESIAAQGYSPSPLREAEAGSEAAPWLDERPIFLAHERSRGHMLIAPALEIWVSDRLREESSILKERRKGREERLLATGALEPGSQDAKPESSSTGAANRACGRGRGGK